MTFDQTVLIWCVAVPAVIAAGGCVASKFSKPAARGWIAALCWWLAVTAAIVGLQGWQWWPEDAWRQAIWPLLAWALLAGAMAVAEDRSAIRWVVVGLLSIATAMIAMPGGEGWEDTFRFHRIWIGLVAASCLVNTYALQQLSRAGGHRWSLLVALAALGGPMALAASTYGSLAQWTVAMIAATGVVAAFAVFSRSDSDLWTAAIPSAVGAAGITAAGRFHSYETHPSWVYAVILFLPAAVALIDLTIRRQSNWRRVLVSGLVSATAVAACVWQLLLR